MNWFLGTNYRRGFAEAVQEVSASLDKLAYHPKRPPSVPAVDPKAIAIRQDILRKLTALPMPRTWRVAGAIGYLHGIECIAVLLTKAWQEEAEPGAKAFLYDEASQVYEWGRKNAREIYRRVGAKIRYPTDDAFQALIPLMSPAEQMMLQLHSDRMLWIQLRHTED